MDSAVIKMEEPTLRHRSRTSRRLLTALGLAAVVVLYLCVALLVVYMAKLSGNFKDGEDTLFYVHRGELLYRSITQEGNWFPLIDLSWYNGVQTFRCWSPLPVYILTGCQALAGGNSDTGFLLFIGLCYLACALVWLVIGCTHHRPWMGATLGLIWFLVPNNLFMFFNEGTLAQSISLPAIPIFFVALYDYLDKRRWSALPTMVFSFLFIILCHVDWAGMIAVSTLCYLLFYLLAADRKDRAAVMPALLSILLAFLISGLLLVPTAIGGLADVNSVSAVGRYVQSLLDSVNPFLGLSHGQWNRWLWAEAPYFGLSTLCLCVLGVPCAKRKGLPGFLTALLILVLSTPTMYGLLAHLPGSRYLWMTRFISIAVCLALVSFFFWLSLKRQLQTTFLILFAVEVLLGTAMISHAEQPLPPNDVFDITEQTMLLDQGKAITTQRMSIIDPYAMVPQSIYVGASYGEDRKPTSFGQGTQAAPQYSNLVQLNEAAETEQYLYLFDRCLELGNDTVIVPVDIESWGQRRDLTSLQNAANQVGYRMVAENEHYRLYHIDTPDTFGVVSTYRAAAIGTGTGAIALSFPAVEELQDTRLDGYTYEDLEHYDVIYLSGFTYDSKKDAEALITRLSQNGTRFLILADGIPADEHTGSKTFLDVSCNTVNFQNGYPALDTIDGVLYCDLFPEGYTKDWKTVYLNGLTNVWGTITDVPEGRMDFYGTGENENVVFIGLALTYHYSLTQDPTVGMLLSHALNLSPTELPKREIVPITVDYHNNVITIDSPRDNVNTTLAFHDIFDADRPVEEVNNLTVVGEGRTVIHLRYPHLLGGLIVSTVGVVLSACYLVMMKKRLKNRSQQEESQTVQPQGDAQAPQTQEAPPDSQA